MWILSYLLELWNKGNFRSRKAQPATMITTNRTKRIYGVPESKPLPKLSSGAGENTPAEHTLQKRKTKPYFGIYAVLSVFILIVLFSFFWPYCEACGILIPWPVTEPQPSAVKVLSPNHWTTREFPSLFLIEANRPGIKLNFLMMAKLCPLEIHRN